MSKIKNFMMDAYYMYEDGMSVEDIAKELHCDNVEFVKEAIETQKKIFDEE